jgi:hypothetical protein
MAERYQIYYQNHKTSYTVRDKIIAHSLATSSNINSAVVLFVSYPLECIAEQVYIITDLYALLLALVVKQK